MSSEKITISDLRRRSGSKTKQSVIAMEMSVQEPAISKLERKKINEASVDKLFKYIKAIGGKAELSVTLDNGEVIVIS